jgi:Asp-tRNA(Asn)/Glu-tRNA(Gln) amidotransferase A subunit family amidase
MIEQHDSNPQASTASAIAGGEQVNPRTSFACVDSSNAGYFTGLSVDELGARLRRGEVTAVSLVQAALDSIARLNPTLNAFVHVGAQAALQQACIADRALADGHDAGPLHGIPVAVKDNIDTADMPTTYGSAHFAGHRPHRDARCIANLREAGAIIIGKTLTHEFAYGPTGDRSLQGAARNPANTARMTGGSSAGSAAAVAAGMVPLAVGTDTGGSIRIPAAFCGAVGFKPGFDVVSTEGVFPLSSSLDHVGPIAGTVKDCALLFDALRSRKTRGPRVARSSNFQLRDLCIGWVAPGCFGPIDGRLYDKVFAHATEMFGKTPDLITELTPLAARFQTSLVALQRAEAYEVHADRMKHAPELFEKEVRKRLDMSAETPGWEYIRARKEQIRLQDALAELFVRYDLLLMPTVPTIAPLIDERMVLVRDHAGEQRVPTRNAVLSLTSPWNLVGLPSISVPAGLSDGMPIGLQIIGAKGSDDQMLDALTATESYCQCA